MGRVLKKRIYCVKSVAAIVVACFLISGCAGGIWRVKGDDPWTTTDTMIAGVGLAALMLDYNQTRRHGSNPRFDETNPILGPEPSPSRCDIYFPVSAIIAGVLAYNMKETPRRLTLWGIAAGEIWCIVNNSQNGWD